MPSAPDTDYIKSLVKSATRLLYPRARAFKLPFNGILDRLHDALAISETKAFRDALLVLDSTIADNDNFTADDATDWERRLGIYSGGSSVPLPDRMQAINRKINHPGTQKARQNWRYIQAQLQAAGFPVFIHENRFDDLGSWITKTPEQILGISAGAAFHSSSVYHGAIFHGATFKNIIANHIEEDLDSTFVIGSNYRSTFYVTGGAIDEFGSIPEVRKNEFRQLLLLLKPAQTVGFLFINYI